MPMGRHYEHMSVDVEMAQAVGGCQCESPVLLRVDAAPTHASGVASWDRF